MQPLSPYGKKAWWKNKNLENITDLWSQLQMELSYTQELTENIHSKHLLHHLLSWL